MSKQDILYEKYAHKLDELLDKIEPTLRKYTRGIERLTTKEQFVQVRNEVIGFAQSISEVVCGCATQLAAAYLSTAIAHDSSWPDEPLSSVETPSAEVIEKDVRYAARFLFREEPDTDAFVKSVATQIERHGLATANRTITENCKDRKIRYARVPTSAHPCDFCLMLASRGFVYASEKSAGELNRFHNGCRCKIVPGFGENPKLKGYDPAALATSCKHRKGYREAMEERDARIAAGALDKLKQNQLYHLEGTKQFELVANARGKNLAFSP